MCPPHAITGRTGVLGILGDPIAHAQAPALVNAALAARNVDAVLVPLHVGRDDLADVVRGLRGIRSMRGAVVTMPHKAAIVPLLDEVSRDASLVGACNVVRRMDDGRLVGTMMDGEGFVDGLAGAGHDVATRRVLLAGAGGAAAAIAFALAAHGVRSIAIVNRTRTAAETLAARLASVWPRLAIRVGAEEAGDVDLVVNATSLGMRPDDPLPVDPAVFRPGVVAAEIVIRPEPTPFLAAAAGRGAATHPGRPMLEAQIERMVAFILGA